MPLPPRLRTAEGGAGGALGQAGLCERAGHGRLKARGDFRSVPADRWRAFPSPVQL